MNEEILLEMLDIAIDFINEQEACCFCIHRDYPSDCSHTDACCKDGIFEGLKRMAQRNIRKVS